MFGRDFRSCHSRWLKRGDRVVGSGIREWMWERMRRDEEGGEQHGAVAVMVQR